MNNENLNTNTENVANSPKADLLKFRPSNLMNFDPKKLKLNKKTLVTAAIVVAIGFGAYYFKGNVVAAVVNGKPILQSEVMSEFKRRNGAAILEGLVNKSLLEQEAKAKGVIVTSQEIDADLAQIQTNMEAQATDLNTELEAQNLTLDEFKVLLKTNKTLEKLIADRVAVTEEEVNNYITANKDVFPAGTSEEAKKSQVTTFLQQQKVESESQILFQELRSKAKINYWTKY